MKIPFGKSLKSLLAIPLDFWFQVSLIGIILFFTFINKPYPHLHDHEVIPVFFHFLGACIINYYLLPKFLYRKQYLFFLSSLLGLVIAMAYINEAILDPWLFSESKRFSGFKEIIYGIVEIAPSMLLFVGVKFGVDILKKQNELEKLKAIASESELQFLKSQINPHFLFNHLNNLYAYSLENSPKTPQIILGLSSLLRYMLYDSKGTFVPLDKEIKYLEDYVHLQELQIEDRGSIAFEAKGKFNDKQIAPLILIVFVENCFKHSTSSQTRNIKINVQVNVINQRLFLHCTNTFEDRKNTDHLTSGIGLENVKTRLQLLYPEAHHLEITNQNNVFEVNLSIELK